MKTVSKTGYWVLAFLMAVVVLGLQIGVDLVERYYGIHGAALYFDEALMALIFSGLVMYLIRQSRMEREQRQRAIRAMNHHVRNALQSILYADHLGGPDRQRKYIAESVNRIEQAVWEVSNSADSGERKKLAAN